VHEIAGVLRGAADGLAFFLFSTIPLLMSHFKYGQITLAQTIESCNIGHALSQQFELWTKACHIQFNYHSSEILQV
jgi:hypothetical protein